MRLVMLGNTQMEHSWKQQVARDAILLGWDLIHIDPDISVDSVVEVCRDADMLLWIFSYKQQIQGDVARMLRRIEDGGCVTVSMHQDLYWGIPYREEMIKTHPFWTAQYVFSPDGGNQDRFAALNINHNWLPPALGTDCIYKGDMKSRYKRHDIVFVGDCNPIIHRGNRRRMLSWAYRKYGRKFGWYGSEQSRYGYVYNGSLNDLFASTKIVLGDTATPKREIPKRYWSDRLPITLGRGGVLVHNEVEGMTEQGFEDSQVLRTFPHGNFQALGEIIDSLLEDPEERERLIEAGMKMMINNHTWAHRLLQIQETVDNEKE